MSGQAWNILAPNSKKVTYLQAKTPLKQKLDSLLQEVGQIKGIILVGGVEQEEP